MTASASAIMVAHRIRNIRILSGLALLAALSAARADEQPEFQGAAESVVAQALGDPRVAAIFMAAAVEADRQSVEFETLDPSDETRHRHIDAGSVDEMQPSELSFQRHGRLNPTFDFEAGRLYLDIRDWVGLAAPPARDLEIATFNPAPYDYANSQVGVEFRATRRFLVFARAGVSIMKGEIGELQIGDTGIRFVGPSGKVGFLLRFR